MKILTQPASYTQSSPGGTVWGSIWVEIDGYCFPESGWSDMALAVLRGWLEKIDNFLSKDFNQVRLLFMDGPFEMRILKISPDLCELVLFKRDLQVVLESTIVSSQELLAVAVAAGAQAAIAFMERGFKSEDLDCLIALIGRLKP